MGASIRVRLSDATAPISCRDRFVIVRCISPEEAQITMQMIRGSHTAAVTEQSEVPLNQNAGAPVEGINAAPKPLTP